MKQLPSNVTGKDAMAETLTAFQIFLQNRDMSPNTISSYMFGAKDFLERYGEITPEHISLYKAYLIDHYQNTCSEFISQIPAKRKYEYAAFKNSTKKIYRICDQPGRL